MVGGSRYLIFKGSVTPHFYGDTSPSPSFEPFCQKGPPRRVLKKFNFGLILSAKMSATGDFGPFFKKGAKWIILPKLGKNDPFLVIFGRGKGVFLKTWCFQDTPDPGCL